MSVLARPPKKQPRAGKSTLKRTHGLHLMVERSNMLRTELRTLQQSFPQNFQSRPRRVRKILALAELGVQSIELMIMTTPQNLDGLATVGSDNSSCLSEGLSACSYSHRDGSACALSAPDIRTSRCCPQLSHSQRCSQMVS
jgi:hypothetical protein